MGSKFECLKGDDRYGKIAESIGYDSQILHEESASGKEFDTTTSHIYIRFYITSDFHAY